MDKHNMREASLHGGTMDKHNMREASLHEIREQTVKKDQNDCYIQSFNSIEDTPLDYTRMKDNILLVGAIGCGESYLINRIRSSLGLSPRVSVTVSATGCAYKHTDSRNVWIKIDNGMRLVQRTNIPKAESRYDSDVQKQRVLKNSLPVLNTELRTDSLVDFFCKSGIVTYGEMYEGWRSNKMFEYVKDMDSGSYDAFNSCLVESSNEYLVHCLEEQQAKLERIIMSETEKRQKIIKEKESVSNRWQEFLTEVFRRTVGSESNLHARKQESEINRSYLLKHLHYVFWKEDFNTSVLSDSNERDLEEFTMRSDKESFKYKYGASVSRQTDNVPVKVEPIADGSYEMQADEAFRELEQMLMCKVCLNADLCIVFLPCRHMATCERCASVLQSCPVCRSTIQDSIKFNYE